MSAPNKSGFSSAFDDMLAGNAKQFDALFGDGGAVPATRVQEGSPSAPPPASAKPAPRHAAARNAVPAGAEDVGRFLDGRYGADGWSWEVAERSRDGDEVTVLVKLGLAVRGISKSQFATTSLVGGALAGSVGGLSFSVGGAGGIDEATAYEQATATGLRKCSDML
jgi:hypothetical protein